MSPASYLQHLLPLTWKNDIRFFEAPKNLPLSYFRSSQLQPEGSLLNCPYFEPATSYSPYCNWAAPDQTDAQKVSWFSSSFLLCLKIFLQKKRMISVSESSFCSKILNLLMFTKLSDELYSLKSWRSSYSLNATSFSPPLEVVCSPYLGAPHDVSSAPEVSSPGKQYFHMHLLFFLHLFLKPFVLRYWTGVFAHKLIARLPALKIVSNGFYIEVIAMKQAVHLPSILLCTTSK